MRWLTKISLRFRSLFHRSGADGELDSEMRFHLEQQIAANISAGMSPAEARRAALREFGGVEQLKEECRDMRHTNYIHDFVQDLRYGLRVLRKSPGFTVVAVLTLALGIGVNTAIFTIFNAAALRLLPVLHAEQLVAVGQKVRRANGPIHRSVHDDETFVSYSEYRVYAKDNSVFTGLVAYSPFMEANLAGDKPTPLMGTLTSCNYFDVLAVHPALGRFFTDSDCRAPGESAVVILSDSFWHSMFAGDPSIVGESVTLNRTSFRVVGIAPPGFDGTVAIASSFWAPLTMQKALKPDRNYLADDYMSWLAMIGRLKPDVSAQRAAANLGVIASRFNHLQPGRVTTVTVDSATLLAMPSLRTAISIIGALIMAAVGLVLLLACANVANLLLARAAGRRKEIAVRLTVGASRARLIRQLLTESLLLAFLGGAVGALASVWSVAAIFNLAMAHLPIDPEIAFALHITSDFHTWFYAFALSVLTACMFGLAPALRASRTDLTLAMKEDGAHSQTGAISAGRLRNFLICAQVAVCMILLLASGLLLHGLYRAQTVNPGFLMENIEAVAFDLGTAGYTQQRAAVFEQQLRDRAAALPGVDAVAQAEIIPLGNQHDMTGFSTPENGKDYEVEYNCVSPSFFPLLGIPILQGHNFTDQEARSGAHLVILTQSTAHRFWPRENPIGKTVHGETADWQVIGIATDAEVATLGDPDKLYLYRPAGPNEQSGLNLMVHSGAPDAAVSKAILDIAKNLDPNLPVTVAPLAGNLEFWRAPARVVSVMSGILGVLALLLASIGIYGMVSYGVSRRTREIGIRMALGAHNRDVMQLVLRQAMSPVVIGIVIGAGCCAGVSRLLVDMLFGVSPWDPISFVCMPLFLFVVALMASYIPARRAMRVDPMVALRYE